MKDGLGQNSQELGESQMKMSTKGKLKQKRCRNKKEPSLSQVERIVNRWNSELIKMIA